MDHLDLAELGPCLSFLQRTQSKFGGFGKEEDDFPDPMHTYLAIAALSLFEIEGMDLAKLDPLLNIPVRARTHLEEANRVPLST